MKCPTRNELVRHLDEVLDDEQQAEMAKHIAGCDRCRSLLARLSREDEAFIECFRESFETPIRDADEERIVTSLLTLHRMRRSERTRDIPSREGDDGREPE